MSTHDESLRDRPPRRIRVDAFAKASSAGEPTGDQTRSGRRVVIEAGLTLLVLGGFLSLMFRDWRTHYQERAQFGAREVAPAIDPLSNLVPSNVDPDAWRQAIADTHAMLITLTGSNLLDLEGMKALRAEIVARVARSHPETALTELANLWNDLTDRAEPIITPRHSRPKLLPPRPEKDPRLLRSPADDPSKK